MRYETQLYYLFNDLFNEQWANIHPFQNVDNLSGYTELIHDLEKKIRKDYRITLSVISK